MTRARWPLGIFLVLCFFPEVAPAQELFSPGALSNAHRDLEGETNCLRCHEAGMKIPRHTCLKCHVDVRSSIEQQTGFHGHVPDEKLNCESCHQEHLGRTNDLMPWRSNRASFDHRLTGWPLSGKHARIRCEQCHTAKRPRDNSTIYTGLSSKCASCHFDEHRGQEDKACERCHGTRTFKPAIFFEHGLSAYPLTGKHRRAKCVECHPQVRDTSTPAHIVPAPVHPTSFVQYRNIVHSTCTDCHKDPHGGKFGTQCTSCHTTDTWNVIEGSKVKDVAFHDKARFPLQGAHASVLCHSCHGPFGKQPAVFADMKFQSCEDCHVDAHQGQFPASAGHTAPACDKCHTITSFAPSKYDVTDHDKTRFPLQNAHRAVPCENCHKDDASLRERVSPAIKAQLRQQERPLLVSDMQFDQRKPLDRCDSCHQDPHGKQFASRVADRGCADCHRDSSFHDVVFDHNKESRFALTGAHGKVPCASCHTEQEVPGTGVITALYKNLPMQCAACHDDVHAGQMRHAKTGVTECERCHSTTSFKPASKFNHNDPAMSPFPLEGAHTDVPCNNCHTEVRISKRLTVRRYNPMPSACISCHADYHKGALQQVPEWAGQGVTPCAHCHNARSWVPANYAEHDKTAFPLSGEHQSTPCASCHGRDYSRQISNRCDACHRDAHAGEMGMHCDSCHTTENWQSRYGIDAHRLTVFPLRGAHGAIPCQECHVGAFTNNFRGTAATCDGCHDGDYLRAGLTSINHVASNFSTNCRECHDPWAFQRGILPNHSVCFPIANGTPHGLIFCADCHTTLAGAVDNLSCATGTYNCTGCHFHNQAATASIHANLQISNYVYDNKQCYACHPTGT